MHPSGLGGRKYADPNARSANGRTALHRAARAGRLQTLIQLIAQGSNIHLGDSLGEQALGMAARKGHLECVKYLIFAGADINYFPPAELAFHSETALCSAASHSNGQGENHPAIVAALLKVGADPNIGGASKRFP